MKKLFSNIVLVFLFCVGSTAFSVGNNLQLDANGVLVVQMKMGNTKSFAIPSAFFNKDGTLNEVLNIEIYSNGTGQSYFSMNTFSSEVNLSSLDLPKGNYILSATIGKYEAAQKLVI